MSPVATPRHWLLSVAERVGLPGADHLELEPNVPVADAWEEVCRTTGIAPKNLAEHVAAHFRLAVADLERAESKALKLVPESVARRYGVLPLRETNRDLFVATSDPTDLAVEQALGFASGRAPVFEVAPPGEIEEVIESLYSPERALEGLLQAVPAAELDRVSVVEEETAEKVSAREAEMAPVVKLTNLILREAVEQGASDIHIEPGRAGGHVRFRVDGVMRQYMQLPMPALNRVVSRVKILSGLDIADRLRPQDGKTRIRVREKSLDVRVSTVPIRDSEKAVLRILDPQGSLGLEDLGFPQIELDHVRQLLSFRDGIVLVTGPTGSGKTTTLYAALQELSTGETNIMTVEDPVEYELPGIAQIQIEPRRGVTFASALRAALRQDPDVILVGEIRDLETAEVALQASLTGHLVLATLHTNDAVGSIARLVDLGLDRALVAESLRGAVAQRLGRRVCPECVASVESGEVSESDAQLQKQYGVATTVRGAGCRRCGHTGYRGRAAFVEVLLITPEIKRLITQGADSSTITSAARGEGFRLIREVALEAVRDGVTTLEEVDRTLGESAETVAVAAGRDRDRRTTDEIVAATLAAAAEQADVGAGTATRPQVEGARRVTPPRGAAASPIGEETEQAPHILLVDDDGVLRAMARSLLEKNGYVVSEARDGAHAIEQIEGDRQFDLMVLDLNMPRVSGRDVLRRVRGSVATAGLPVIVLTGSGGGDLEIKLMAEGADDYIHKPLEPQRFVARVRAALRRAAAH